MLAIICCLHRPTIIAASKEKSSPTIRHPPFNLGLYRWLRIEVYGFSEHRQLITTRPTAAATSCLRQQRFLGSASLTETCWEVGLQKAVNVILEQRSSKYR